MYVVDHGDWLGSVCRADFHTGKNRHSGCELQPSDGDPHGRGRRNVLGMVFLTNAQKGIGQISGKSWLFLILSGLATGASWLCYYKALQLGEASKVVPIDKMSVVITLVMAFVFLHEQFTAKSLIGAILLTAGTLVMVL